MRPPTNIDGGLISKSKYYHSTAGYASFYTHLRVRLLHTVENPTVIVHNKAAVTVLFLYLCLDNVREFRRDNQK